MKKIKLNTKPFYLSESDIKWVQDTFKNMSLEEKIGQLFCFVGYNCEESYLHDIVHKYHAGGLMARQMGKEELVKTFTLLNGESKIPMILSANMESGSSGLVKGGTNMGSPMQVAATNEVCFAQKLGQICGREGSLCGANLTFAPIVDIDLNFRNPITNIRTFGSNPDTVASMSVEYIKACQENGLAATAKHFPGDGYDELDQHLVTSVNDMSCEEWDKTFGKVFSACIDAGVKCVMVGHIIQPAYTRYFNKDVRDKDLLPASLSKELVTNLLKGKLGFEGLVISDATPMNGFNMALSRDIALPKLIESGCDLITFTQNTEEDFEYIRLGLENSLLTEERFNDAVLKILCFKASMKLHEMKENGTHIPKLTDVDNVINNRRSDCAYLCADKAITLVKEERGVLPITPERFKKIKLHYLLNATESMYKQKNDNLKQFSSLLEKEGFEVVLADNSTGFEGTMASFKEKKQEADLIIYLAELSTKSNQTTVRIEWAMPMGINVPTLIHSVPTIFISLANPYHLLDVPRIKTFINCYASTSETIIALVEKLLGKTKFKGVSPTDPFVGRWDTRL